MSPLPKSYFTSQSGRGRRKENVGRALKNAWLGRRGKRQNEIQRGLRGKGHTVNLVLKGGSSEVKDQGRILCPKGH